jgi:hypothetical protein
MSGRRLKEGAMGISKETVEENAAYEKRPETPAERRARVEKSLESGLEGSFPGSDPINIVQPAPSIYDCRTAGT